jgi:hypothetical protein
VIGSAPEWQRLVVLAPVWVVGAGLVGACVILLGRAFADSWRETQHKRLIVGGLVAIVALVMLLTFLRVSLPNTE